MRPMPEMAAQSGTASLTNLTIDGTVSDSGDLDGDPSEDGATDELILQSGRPLLDPDSHPGAHLEGVLRPARLADGAAQRSNGR